MLPLGLQVAFQMIAAAGAQRFDDDCLHGLNPVAFTVSQYNVIAIIGKPDLTFFTYKHRALLLRKLLGRAGLNDIRIHDFYPC